MLVSVFCIVPPDMYVYDVCVCVCSLCVVVVGNVVVGSVVVVIVVVVVVVMMLCRSDSGSGGGGGSGGACTAACTGVNTKSNRSIQSFPFSSSLFSSSTFSVFAVDGGADRLAASASADHCRRP